MHAQTDTAPSTPTDLLTSDEVAVILRQHPETVLRGLRTGRIPGVKLGRWLTLREDLDTMLRDTQWRRNREHPAASATATATAAPAAPRRQPAHGRASF